MASFGDFCIIPPFVQVKLIGDYGLMDGSSGD